MAVRCSRCNRWFSKQHALEQHLSDSIRHNRCPVCTFDGECWDDLLEHCRESGCRTVCQGCEDGEGVHWAANSDEYWEHVEEFNVCTQCERHFSSPNSLKHHKFKHRTANYACLLGCGENFKIYGGMIMHLERGTCDATITYLNLNETAAECHQWSHFIDEVYREDMLNLVDLEEVYYVKVCPYKCPDCDARLPKLSSLFQHVEGSACGQTLDDGAIRRLRRFLRSRYG